MSEYLLEAHRSDKETPCEHCHHIHWCKLGVPFKERKLGWISLEYVDCLEEFVLVCAPDAARFDDQLVPDSNTGVLQTWKFVSIV